MDADDLGDYYHTCGVSRERALTNAVGKPVAESELEGMAALAAARARMPESCASRGPAPRNAGGRPVRKLQPCLAALPMGDLNAVDYAQLGHMNVVRSSGGLLDANLMRYRAPLPRGPVYDGVVVDDRVVFSKVPRSGGESREAGDCPGIIEAAQPAYAAAGLAAKESKRVRNASVAETWGGAHRRARRYRECEGRKRPTYSRVNNGVAQLGHDHGRPLESCHWIVNASSSVPLSCVRVARGSVRVRSFSRRC